MVEATNRRQITHEYDPVNCLHCADYETKGLGQDEVSSQDRDSTNQTQSYRMLKTPGNLIDMDLLQAMADRQKLTKQMEAKGIKVRQ